MTMKRIKLELARDHEFPDGSSERGYEFAAPLDDAGHIVASEWRKQRERCRVIRHWPGEKNQVGRLVHRGGGWAFDYNPKSTDDDEPGFKFDRHRFVPGEYVSLKEQDGAMRTFRVIWVRDLDE
jgi:hypothetical protein